MPNGFVESGRKVNKCLYLQWKARVLSYRLQSVSHAVSKLSPVTLISLSFSATSPSRQLNKCWNLMIEDFIRSQMIKEENFSLKASQSLCLPSKRGSRSFSRDACSAELLLMVDAEPFQLPLPVPAARLAVAKAVADNALILSFMRAFAWRYFTWVLANWSSLK